MRWRESGGLELGGSVERSEANLGVVVWSGAEGRNGGPELELRARGYGGSGGEMRGGGGVSVA